MLSFGVFVLCLLIFEVVVLFGDLFLVSTHAPLCCVHPLEEKREKRGRRRSPVFVESRRERERGDGSPPYHGH